MGIRLNCLRAAVVAVGLTLGSTALADAGEFALGVSGGATYPAGGRGELRLEMGINERFSARLSGGSGYDQRAFGIGDVSLVWAFDVVRWVPEIEVGSGIRGDATGVNYRGRVLVGVRYFVKRRWALGGQLGVEVTSSPEVLSTVMFSVWRYL